MTVRRLGNGGGLIECEPSMGNRVAKIQCECDTRAQTTSEPSVKSVRLGRLKLVKNIDVTIHTV